VSGAAPERAGAERSVGAQRRDEAFERAVEALSRRERTAAELGSWLAERGFAPAETAAAVERLVAAEALDDERFARRYAEDKRELRGWGPERIRKALAARGVEPELIEDALTADGRDSQLERAIALLAGRDHRPADEASRARALAFLARRGYDAELAYDAVRALERRVGNVA
jgi:regulatory protein